MFQRESSLSASVAQAAPAMSSASTSGSATAAGGPASPQPKQGDGGAAPASHSSSHADDASTFIAIRYDKTRVFFRIADQRADFELDEARYQKLPSLGKPVAESGGDSVWEPDAELLNAHHELFDRAHAGEEWQLEVSADSSITVVVQKPVVVSSGCFVFAGFLAESSNQVELAVPTKQYFLIRRASVVSGLGPGGQASGVGLLPDWKATLEFRAQIDQILKARMKEELPKVHTESAGEYERAADANETEKAWAEHWKDTDRRLALGEGTLDYDIQAFRLTPDGEPRLFVRARWAIEHKAAFLLSAWLRAGSTPVVESADAREAGVMRMREFVGTELDLASLGTVLNVFDRQRDGHGELLIYSPGYEGYDIRLFRYTESGPVATEIRHGGGC